jgi:hypothetical protein
MRSTWLKLRTDQRVDVRAAPARFDQQVLVGAQRPQPLVDAADVVLLRAVGNGVADDRLHHGEQVLAAVVHLAAQDALCFLEALPLRNIACDLGGADDPPLAVPNRGDGHRDGDARPVLAPPYRIEMLDTFTPTDARDNARLLVLPVVGDDARNRLADHFCRREPENLLRPGVPGRHDAIQIL